MNEVLVSICCQAYNHEPYIRQCIEGFLMQKANFLFEVLIHDDASTDKTATIVREYEVKYPDIIKPIYQTENQYSKGVKISPQIQYPRAKGKYIALCEGDDYWTDPLKLQKQVDFLEGNPEFSLCFHNAMVKYEGKKNSHLFTSITNDKFYIKDIIEREWFIPTQSIVFRKDLLESPLWISRIMHGDLCLLLLLVTKGPFKYIDNVMSVYRRTGKSIANTTSGVFRSRKKLELLFYFNFHTNFKYNDNINKRLNIEFDALYRRETKLSSTVLYYFIKILNFVCHKKFVQTR